MRIKFALLLVAICSRVEGDLFGLPKIVGDGISILGNTASKVIHHTVEVPAARAISEASKFTKTVSKSISSVLEGITEFSNLAWDEFNSLFNGFILSRVGPSRAVLFVPKAMDTIPESIDWRQVGAVSTVKHQKRCKSCWAFSVAGALEGQIYMKTGKLIEVSVQSLLDCAKGKQYGNYGCGGGLTETGFDFINDNKGIDSEASYPYEAKNGACRYNEDNVVAQCKEYFRVPDGDEKSLEIAVATVGPISAAIHVVPRFKNYTGGVIDYAECGNQPNHLNHAVLIVGYGKEEDGKEYWLVKNSYGTNWGLDGYFKVAKNAGNQCGIATYARYPKI